MKHQFHNLEFSHNQLKSITEYCSDRTWEISDTIVTSIEMGVKVSFSYDEYHNCALMSLTPKIEEHPFYGYVVSIRNTNIERLLGVLLWLTAEGWDAVDPPKTVTSRYDW